RRLPVAFLLVLALVGADGAGSATAATPAASMVAYVVGGISDHVAVVGADGRGERQLSLGKGVGSWEPGWSPDGSRIAYAFGWGSTGTGIAVATLDGSQVAEVAGAADGDADRPRWSPNGRWIAFETYPVVVDGADSGDYLDLWVVRPDGTHRRLLLKSVTTGPGDGSSASQNGAAWSWSPDGRSIAIEWPAPSANPNADPVLNVEVEIGRAHV